MSDDDLVVRINALSDHDSERLLQAVMDQLLVDISTLSVEDEESARELIAAFVSKRDEPIAADNVVGPSVGLSTHVRSTLLLIAADPHTAPLVHDTLDDLPDETQMFAEPVTAALVLGVLVAFLQTKFEVTVSRKSGRVDYEFTVKKDATSDETIGKVVRAVSDVAVR